MQGPGILTLTTDFGGDGPYVAAMKGVVLGLAPESRFVDVSHAIAPQNILEGAFILSEIVEMFPAGTVHLAVIDPGVGTDRRLIAARLADQWFVLPDNGLLSGLTRHRTPSGVWQISNPALRRANVSATFHGRDILAPAAAHLLNGRDPADLGPAVLEIVTLSNFQHRVEADGYLGEVIYRDTFGNLITNLDASLFASTPADSWTVEIAGERLQGLGWTYGNHAQGCLIALFGGTGRLEVAVVNGDAAEHLSASTGTPVRVRRRS